MQETEAKYLVPILIY